MTASSRGQADTLYRNLSGRSYRELKNDAAFLEYRREWLARPRTFEPGAFPLHLDLEVTSVCNLRCSFCATTFNEYRDGMMAEPVWRAALDQAGAARLASVKFNFRGEPTLHRALPEIVAYAKSKGILDVFFNTNATRLGPELGRRLIEAGLDRMTISFEGTTKELYESKRVRAKFESVLENVRGFMELKRSLRAEFPVVRIQTVMIPEMEGRTDEYVAFWEGIVDEVACLNLKQEHDVGQHSGRPSGWACPYLWQRLTVLWDGTILPCNHDYFGQMSLGNVLEDDLASMWSGPRMEAIRRLHRSGSAHMESTCDRCPLRASEVSRLSLSTED